MKKILSAFLLLSFLFSCSERDKIAIERSASVFDIEQGKASIEQSNIRFAKAFKNADSAVLANCYTRDAKIFINEIPTIEGRDSIRVYYGRLLERDLSAYNLKSTNIWGDSTILVEEGEFRLIGPKKKEIDRGNYIVLWRTEGGNWKMFRHMWKSDYATDALLPLRAADTTALPGGDTLLKAKPKRK